MRDIHPIQPVHSFLLTKIIILSKLEQEIFHVSQIDLCTRVSKIEKCPRDRPRNGENFAAGYTYAYRLPTNGKRLKRREALREDEEKKEEEKKRE